LSSPDFYSLLKVFVGLVFSALFLQSGFDKVIDFNIRRFIDLYGFSEDDLPFENLKRWYFRERERINKRLNARTEHEYAMMLSYASTDDWVPITKRIHLNDEQYKSLSIPKSFQLMIPFN
jgi:hypothetical protein